MTIGARSAAMERPTRERSTAWGCLASTFCGCWCQCLGCCALAQESREVERLTGHEEPEIDYLTFQPFSEYCPAIDELRVMQIRSPLRHVRNVAAVLLVLVLFALSDVDSNFTLENMLVLLLTLGQAAFIEYLVHWRWCLFDLSFDSVVKYFGEADSLFSVGLLL